MINKSHKLLIRGGYDGNVTNRVDMMVIDNEGTKISWQACAPMIKKRCYHSAYYCQGQVLSVSINGFGADAQGENDNEFDSHASSERYDVLSQAAVKLEQKLPIPNLHDVAMAELDGKAFVIGGYRGVAFTGQGEKSDRVFCLDNKRHRGQAGTWIEQEARLITGRSQAAAATHQARCGLLVDMIAIANLCQASRYLIRLWARGKQQAT